MKDLMMKDSKLLTYFNGSVRKHILNNYKDFITLYEAEECEMERLELVIVVYAELLYDIDRGLEEDEAGNYTEADVDKFFEDNAELMDKLAEDD